MLAILGLKDNAYGVTIRRQVSKASGKEWSIGAIYDPLYRLEQKGFVESYLSEPTAERGGRSKRMFIITENGKRALVEHRKVRDILWNDLKDVVINK
jgi:DNA-binding PadR family transcriptional regulator